MKKQAYYSDYIWYDCKLLEKQWLLVENDVITGCTTVKPENGYDTTEFKNSAIFPTLINTHTHAAMVMLRGFADDMPLYEWLNDHIWPAEGRLLSPEFIKDACKLAAAELIRGGVSCIADMYFFVDEEMETLSNIGLRAVCGNGTFGEDLPSKTVKEIEELAEKYKNHSLMKLMLCPHAVYTASPKVYKELVRLAQKHDLILHTHLSETSIEVENAVKQYGKTPSELMEEAGAFDCKNLFAHCVHLTDNDMKLMGKKKANVSHCLQSNLKLASGFAPVTKMMQAGINVTIGTDGASSNNDLDMLSEMKSVALFHKGYTLDPTAMDAKTTLLAATENAAKALYIDNTGVLKKGYQADFMVVSYDKPHMQPVHSPLSNLIYSAHKDDITDVFVAGKQLMKDRRLTTIDEKDAIENFNKWKKSL